jgi:long-subunit acyl-CoA synthetase (AMP-forming)
MGYYNDPEKTKQAFINNPFSKSSTDKLYKTGDKGRFLPDGKIEIAGRISSSNLVKLHGVRIELEEIETLLMQHPQIQQAFVHLWDNEHLTGYLLMKDESKLEYLELRNFLKEKGLTTIKIPSDFITITDIPLTKNGKLNKNFLPRPLLTEDIITSLYESPLTKTELTLRAMWKKIFGSKQIDREDSFRDIGGNSFWIISLLAKINKVFFKERGQRLTLSQLPPDFSIKSLGELIDGLLANQMSATSPSMQSIYDEFYNSF